MKADTITVEAVAGHAGVMLVRIDHPPMNVVGLPQYHALAQVFEEMDERPDVRCVVLTAAGEKAFIGGADVRQLVDRTPQRMMERGRSARRAFHAVRDCSVPVVCALNGSAVGAGLVVASVCDAIVAVETARFALPEVTVGVLGGARHLSRILPEKVVRWMALSGEPVDAEFMHAQGAVHAVVPRQELLPTALAMADRIAAKSGVVTRMLKDCLNIGDELPLREGFRLEQVFTALAASMPDAREAALAWVEKRAPRFSDGALTASSGLPGDAP